MKRLKTFAGVFAAIALVAGIAIGAPYNIQQKDTGTVWSEPGGTAVPVGGVIVVEFTSIQDAWTKYVMAHKAGTIRKVWAVSDEDLAVAAGTTISFSMATSGAAGSIFRTLSGLSLVVSGGREGFVTSDTPDSDIIPFTQGDTIAIRSDGGSSEIDSPGRVMIFIE